MTTTNKLYFSGFKISDSQQGEEIVESCIANISPRERQLRMRFGVVMFFVSIMFLVALVAFDVNPLWRLLLFVMFTAAATGYFEAKDKTWVALASRGLRKVGDTAEKIDDDNELKQVRHQALKVYLKSTLVALVLTLIAYLIP